MQTDDRRLKMIRRINVGSLALVVALCVGSIVALGFDVQRRLEALARASSDSVQWVLAQLEIELMMFEISAVQHPPNLSELRDRFDIFYSRVSTPEGSALYSDLRAQPDFADSLSNLREFLNRSVAVIDGPDAGLRSAIPVMLRALPGLRADARTMSLAGISFFAVQSDMQREAVATTLRRMAAVTIVLVAATGVLSVMFLRLYRRTQAQAEDNRLTSARLETVVKSSVDAIVVVDRQGTVLAFNPAAETIFGYTRAEALGADVTRLIFPPEAIGLTIRAIEQQLIGPDAHLSGLQRIELEALRKDRSRFPVELSVGVAESTDGQIVVAFLRDISARRQAEHDLTEARDQALRGEKAKAEFLAVMSHEMRTPLNGLLGSTEILGLTPLDPRQRELLEVIETSAQGLLYHANSVLDVSRAEAGAMRLERVGFSVEALVHETVANQRGLAAAAGNRIEIAPMGEPVGRVTGDPGRLRQILLNLVGNAVKFTRNGTIRIEIAAEGAKDGTRMVALRVIDSGIGIADKDLERVFDDFVTLDTSYGRAAGGTGLGLGIARRLVQAMGGTIGVQSLPGAGSTFSVHLPFAPDAPLQVPPVDAGAGALQPSPLSVLVIEDNPINRFVLRSLLEEIGHAVAEAENGLEGVAMASARAHDVILMDISMPLMDGVAAARAIRAGNGPSAAARIIAVTAHALPEDQATFRAAGMGDCLTKPITRGALAAALDGRRLAEPVVDGAGLVLDAAVLADMVTHLGRDRAAGLAGQFLDEGQAALKRLAGDVPTHDLRALCHRFAGSAATFGAARLAGQLQLLETALAAGFDASPLLAPLPCIWADTCAAIAAAFPDDGSESGP